MPWSRYPDEGLDNLVASDQRCNSRKRDCLAAGEHVERWVKRTLSVARAIYLRLAGGARPWLNGPERAPFERDRIGGALA